jgi:sugar lactone lactonase YvrE
MVVSLAKNSAEYGHHFINRIIIFAGKFSFLVGSYINGKVSPTGFTPRPSALRYNLITNSSRIKGVIMRLITDLVLSFRLILAGLLIAQLIMPSVSYLSTKQNISRLTVHPLMPLRAVVQSSDLKIVGPDKDPNPVVNEGRQLQLSVIDVSGQAVTGVTFESGSPDIAQVNPQTGMIIGIQRGFATITGRRGSESVSNFVVVARVSSGKGMRVMGKTEVDTSGAIYLSDPVRHVIFKKDTPSADLALFAGQSGVKGKTDGPRTQAQFAGPLGITVDNRARGGIYIADTLNHNIRKISNDRVERVLGMGMPGRIAADIVPFDQAVFSSPQGVTVDTGGNLLIADTDNHAIYLADFEKRQVELIAGEPGMSGKVDGIKRLARFNRPTAITVVSTGKSFFRTGEQKGILVADTGNNVVRFVTFDGKVETVGPIPKTSIVSQSISPNTADNEFAFDQPISVSSDGIGNIYVVDRSGVKLITEPVGQARQLVSLAQPGASFIQAESVTVRGAETFVLDTNATTEAEAVKVVTVGEPAIANLSQTQDRMEGGAEITITGRNFAPESQVVLGDSVATDVIVESATKIRFRVPMQSVAGNRTLSVRTRGGIAQRKFSIISKPLSELANGEITTIAGGIPFVGDGGKALNASLNFRFFGGISVDGAGNLFIPASSRIRMVDSSTRIITTVAGSGNEGFSGDGGQAVSASLDNPESVAIDGAGNIFIADMYNERIRRVDARTGIITTVAGGGMRGLSDGIPATEASFFFLTGIAIDGAGNLFIADPVHSRIRKVDARTQIITTVAGSEKGGFSGDGGPATEAKLDFPRRIAVDELGNLFIADQANNRIRRVDAKTGIITTVAGDGFKDKDGFGRFTGDGGPATRASLNIPLNVAVDGMGNLFIADFGNGRIRRVDARTGIITTVAGNGTTQFGGDGGPATRASLSAIDVAVDGSGNLFIADSFNQRIRRVEGSVGTISTVAGDGTTGNFNGDGELATSAALSFPRGLALDGTDDLFFADSSNARVRRIDANTGIITTVAGNGDFRFSGDGGPATSAGLDPASVAVDKNNNIYIADAFNARIRKVDTATGIITTVVGNRTAGFSGDDGPATAASLRNPLGVVTDGSEALFILDAGNSRVRRFDLKTGKITTVAGNGTKGFSGDGGLATNASLNLLNGGIGLDRGGNLYIAEYGNRRIRRVDARSGIITTVAGNGRANFSGDGGPATSASLNQPTAVTADAAGNIFIADFFNEVIRRVDARTGIITTVAGNGSIGFSGDGGPAINAGIFLPEGVAVDGMGNLIIADTFHDAIRIVKGIAKVLGDGQSSVTITSATFSKPNLIINGTGFGSSGAAVIINGQDTSSLIFNQTDTSIDLKGSKKRLNLKKGPNQIVVTAGGMSSNTIILNLFIADLAATNLNHKEHEKHED